MEFQHDDNVPQGGRVTQDGTELLHSLGLDITRDPQPMAHVYVDRIVNLLEQI
jgi:hypothetical protein